MYTHTEVMAYRRSGMIWTRVRELAIFSMGVVFVWVLATYTEMRVPEVKPPPSFAAMERRDPFRCVNGISIATADFSRGLSQDYTCRLVTLS